MKKKVLIIGGIIVTVSIISYFVVIGIQRLGVKKSLNIAYNNPDSQDAAGGLNKLLTSGVFNPTTYQKSGKATITLTEARDRAQAIWEAYSYFLSSDQMSMVNAFNGLKHQHDVSKIAHEFKASYDDDLLEVLTSALTDKAKINMLVTKINKLPKY